jgi:hypothetical protein
MDLAGPLWYHSSVSKSNLANFALSLERGSGDEFLPSFSQLRNSILEPKVAQFRGQSKSLLQHRSPSISPKGVCDKRFIPGRSGFRVSGLGW